MYFELFGASFGLPDHSRTNPDPISGFRRFSTRFVNMSGKHPGKCRGNSRLRSFIPVYIMEIGYLICGQNLKDAIKYFE